MRFYVLIFLVLGFFQLNAQNYSKLIEKGSYKKAEKKNIQKNRKRSLQCRVAIFLFGIEI